MAREHTVTRAVLSTNDVCMASVKKTPMLAAGDPKSLKTLGHFGGIGFEMAIFVVLGVKGGQWLDGYFGTTFLTLVGLAVGLFAGFRSLAQLTHKLRRAAAANETSTPITVK
ncbi:MAG: hypothetical protein ACI9KE_002487 [Polyangiales bacterium]|jgi:hypothetical protein